MRALLDTTAIFLREHAPKIYSRDLAEVIFVQPYCRIRNLVDAGIAHRETASIYLKRLAALRVRTEVKAGREKLFIHPRLVAVLRNEPGVAPPLVALARESNAKRGGPTGASRTPLPRDRTARYG